MVDAPPRRPEAHAPTGRVVVQFDYHDAKRTTIWLVFDRGEPSVCMNHPGFEPDLVVTTDSLSMMRVFSGVDELRRGPGQRARPHRRACRGWSRRSRRGSCGARSATVVQERVGQLATLTVAAAVDYKRVQRAGSATDDARGGPT